MSVFRNKAGTRWVAQVYDPASGRMQQVGTYDRKADAKAAVADATRRKLTSSITVADFADRWLTEFPRTKPSSAATHAERVKPLVAQYGHRRMDSITVVEARRWALEHKHCLPGPRAMWNDARKAGLIVHNPFAQLGIEQSRGRRDLPSGWLTADQISDLADRSLDVLGAYGPTFRGLVLFAAYTGMRPGEMFCVEWGDLQADTIVVQRGADSRTRTVGTPKNSYARTIVYPQVAQDAVATVPRMAGQALVFPSPRGRQFWASTFSRYWDKVRCAAGRPEMDAHELRHFCATFLLELGLSPADVAIQLGHRDGGRMVTQVYGHPDDRLARERIRRALNGASTGDLADKRKKRGAA